jgi:hypothetical protein
MSYKTSNKWTCYFLEKIFVNRRLNRCSLLFLFIHFTIALVRFLGFGELACLSTFGSESIICCLTVTKFRNICSSSFIRISLETHPCLSDAVSSFSSVPVVPIGIRFWSQSSSQFIKRFTISTKTELLFLVHRILKDDGATLPSSLYSLDLDRIGRTVDSLRPSALLMLALLW